MNAGINSANLGMGDEIVIKGVIFDLDGTLYDYHENDKIAMQQLCQFAKSEFDVDESRFRDIFEEAKKIVKDRVTDGGSRHSRFLHCQTALELLNENPFHYTEKMTQVYWDTFFDHMKLYEGALQFLRGLKDANIKMAICTDMTAEIQYMKLRRLGIIDFFDAIVTSQETGTEKPAPIMFELALKKLNIKASEAAYFGDSLERDVEGAAKCGLLPFWYIANRAIDESKPVTYTKVRSYKDVRF